MLKLGKNQFFSIAFSGALLGAMSLLQSANAHAWGAAKYLYFVILDNESEKYYSLNMDSLYPTILKGSRGDLECSYKDKGGNVQKFKFATDPCGPMTGLSIELSKAIKEVKIEASADKIYSDHKSIFLSSTIQSSSEGSDAGEFGMVVLSATQFKNLKKKSEGLPNLANVPEVTISPMVSELSEQKLQCKMPVVQYNCGH